MRDRARVSGFGVSFDLHVPGSSLGRVINRLSPLRFEESSPATPVPLDIVPIDEGWSLLEQGVEVACASELAMLADLAADLIAWRAATAGTTHSFLHAAAVGVGDLAVLFPAPSGAGKSTLAAALVDAGASYLSDEYAPIDDDGLVTPFPRPIAFDQELGQPQRRQVVDRAAIETRRLRPRLVVLTSYQPGGAAELVGEVGKGDAMRELLPHAISHAGSPRSTLARIATLLDEVRVLRVRRGEANEFASWLISNAAALAGAEGENQRVAVQTAEDAVPT